MDTKNTPNVNNSEQGPLSMNLKRINSNFNLWYNIWKKNRDYSSAINLALALGKLLEATAALAKFAEGKNNVLLDSMVKGTTEAGEAAWEELKNAAGRIVPF